jgi:hypothetical protein
MPREKINERRVWDATTALLSTPTSLAACCVFVIAGCGGSTGGTSALKPIDPTTLQATVDATAKDLLVPGAFVLLRTPQGEFPVTYGSTERGDGNPPGPDPHFRVGSVTKTMTAATSGPACPWRSTISRRRDPPRGSRRSSQRTSTDLHRAQSIRTSRGIDRRAPSRGRTSGIGRGGMGLVWEAFDVELRRPVAVKQIVEDLQVDPEIEKRFRLESSLDGTALASEHRAHPPHRPSTRIWHVHRDGADPRERSAFDAAGEGAARCRRADEREAGRESDRPKAVRPMSLRRPTPRRITETTGSRC